MNINNMQASRACHIFTCDKNLGLQSLITASHSLNPHVVTSNACQAIYQFQAHNLIKENLQPSMADVEPHDPSVLFTPIDTLMDGENMYC